VPHGQVTVFGDMSNGPTVPVFHPLGGSEAESAVVAAGDDDISDTRLVPVGQCHLDCGSGVVETVLPGTAVEFGDQLPGGGDHDRLGVTGFEPATSSSRSTVGESSRSRSECELSPCMCA
jgi:hypothetical protein